MIVAHPTGAVSAWTAVAALLLAAAAEPSSALPHVFREPHQVIIQPVGDLIPGSRASFEICFTAYAFDAGCFARARSWHSSLTGIRAC